MVACSDKGVAHRLLSPPPPLCGLVAPVHDDHYLPPLYINYQTLLLMS